MDARIPGGYGPDDEMEHDSEIPVWLQLAAVLVARIERGNFPPRRSIPSESRLVQEFGLARGTVRKTVAFLAEVGYVRTVGGKGSFVVDPSESTGPDVEDAPGPSGE